MQLQHQKRESPPGVGAGPSFLSAAEEGLGASAMVVSGEDFGTSVDLLLQRESFHDLSCLSGAPLPEGAAVVLGFSQRGRTAERGFITRCATFEGGYALTIGLERRRDGRQAS